MLDGLPFLFIQCRPNGAIARDEVKTIVSLGGLCDSMVETHLLLEEPEFDAASIDLNHYSGVFISGSPFGAHAATLAETSEERHLCTQVSAVIKRLLDQDFPTLAICYGLQQVALEAGGALTSKTSEDLQPIQVTLTDAGKADPVAGLLEPVITSYTGHTDSLAYLPNGAALLAVGENARYQLVRFGNNIYGTQFHPEITRAGLMLRIDHYGDTYFKQRERDLVIRRGMSVDVRSSAQLISSFINHFGRNTHNRVPINSYTPFIADVEETCVPVEAQYTLEERYAVAF